MTAASPIFADHETHIRRLLDAALTAADPARSLAAHWPAGLASPRVRVVGGGKAALEMAAQAAALAGDDLIGGAVSVVPDRLAALDAPPTGYDVYPAAHPLPDARNLRAAEAIAATARRATQDDTLVVLLSGGGSAMLTRPAGDLTLEDLAAAADALMRAGAPITALNAVRKHCEQLKGGGLAQLAAPARVVALILSDVVGDPLDVIASGPTAPDPTTYADALAVLREYRVYDALPAVARHLEAGARGDLPETAKPGDPVFERVTNVLIGSNRQALAAVEAEAAALGFHVAGVEAGVEGEAREVGARLGALAKQMRAGSSLPACWLLGGETTVTVRGQGRGGRNQEIALAAALALDGVPHACVASFATDGIDGPTPAAGAVVTGQTAARARALGLDPAAMLDANDSYTFFAQVGGLLTPGATGTNVNDVMIVLAYPV